MVLKIYDNVGLAMQHAHVGVFRLQYIYTFKALNPQSIGARANDRLDRVGANCVISGCLLMDGHFMQ